MAAARSPLLQLGGGALQHLELRDNGLARPLGARFTAVLRAQSALEHLRSSTTAAFAPARRRRARRRAARQPIRARHARPPPQPHRRARGQTLLGGGRGGGGGGGLACAASRRHRPRAPAASIAGGTADGARMAAPPAAASPIRRASHSSAAVDPGRAAPRADGGRSAAAGCSRSKTPPTRPPPAPRRRCRGAEALLGAARAVFDRERSGGTGGAALEVLNPVAALPDAARQVFGAAAPCLRAAAHVHQCHLHPPAADSSGAPNGDISPVRTAEPQQNS